MDKLTKLQAKHPEFIYDSFHWEIKNNQLLCTFKFKLNPDICLTPTVRLFNLDRDKLLRTQHSVIDRMVFHLGLMEIPSYWKAALSPKIIIKAGHLTKKQTIWWRKLFISGLGEFFYLNKLDPKQIKFKFVIKSATSYLPYQNEDLSANNLILPLGGGKDSLVSLELLKDQQPVLFSINPTKAILAVTKKNPTLTHCYVVRKLAPELLELNKQDYFNGHTPFSAYVAFLSSFVALLFKTKYVALSNESSANEATIETDEFAYNHQYSKTTEFEKKFREYSQTFLIPNLEYFSFLRPLNEVQIAKFFSEIGEKYFSDFRSCNRGQKTGVWCHECPKCLFAFLILFPFLDEKILCKQIFQANLFSKKSLVDEALKLVNPDTAKPWECVGTREESLVAFYLSVQKYKEQKKSLPLILKTIDQKILSKQQGMKKRAEKILKSWNKKNFVPAELVSKLKAI